MCGCAVEDGREKRGNGGGGGEGMCLALKGGKGWEKQRRRKEAGKVDEREKE